MKQSQQGKVRDQDLEVSEKEISLSLSLFLSLSLHKVEEWRMKNERSNLNKPNSSRSLKSKKRAVVVEDEEEEDDEVATIWKQAR